LQISEFYDDCFPAIPLDAATTIRQNSIDSKNVSLCSPLSIVLSTFHPSILSSQKKGNTTFFSEKTLIHKCLTNSGSYDCVSGLKKDNQTNNDIQLIKAHLGHFCNNIVKNSSTYSPSKKLNDDSFPDECISEHDLVFIKNEPETSNSTNPPSPTFNKSSVFLNSVNLSTQTLLKSEAKFGSKVRF